MVGEGEGDEATFDGKGAKVKGEILERRAGGLRRKKKVERTKRGPIESIHSKKISQQRHGPNLRHSWEPDLRAMWDNTNVFFEAAHTCGIGQPCLGDQHVFSRENWGAAGVAWS
jgi:hypothetical protein